MSCVSPMEPVAAVELPSPTVSIAGGGVCRICVLCERAPPNGMPAITAQMMAIRITIAIGTPMSHAFDVRCCGGGSVDTGAAGVDTGAGADTGSGADTGAAGRGSARLSIAAPQRGQNRASPGTGEPHTAQ